MFVNLLDLNDNDPKFLNLPFVAEVPEGLAVGSSVYRVKCTHGMIHESAMSDFFQIIFFKNVYYIVLENIFVF